MADSPADNPDTQRVRQRSRSQTALRVTWYVVMGTLCAYFSFGHWSRGDAPRWTVGTAALSLLFVLSAVDVIRIRRKNQGRPEG